MWPRVPLVRRDISEERIASIIRAKKIGEVGTTLAVTGKWSTLETATMRHNREDEIMQLPPRKS
jgi:hypothetical protein